MIAFIIPAKKPVLRQLSNEKKQNKEALLILGLRKSDAKAIEQIYNMYAPALYGIIKRIVKFDEIAEDVLQDTFVKIWKSINLYDSSKGQLFTWMANLAKNLSIDQIRSKAGIKSTKTVDILAVNSSIIDQQSYIHHNTDTIGIKNLMNVLKSDQQLIVELIYFKGYTHVQVSELLNIPLGTIKTKLRLSILFLRKQFGEFKIPA